MIDDNFIVSIQVELIHNAISPRVDIPSTFLSGFVLCALGFGCAIRMLSALAILILANVRWAVGELLSLAIFTPFRAKWEKLFDALFPSYHSKVLI